MSAITGSTTPIIAEMVTAITIATHTGTLMTTPPLALCLDMGQIHLLRDTQHGHPVRERAVTDSDLLDVVHHQQRLALALYRPARAAHSRVRVERTTPIGHGGAFTLHGDDNGVVLDGGLGHHTVRVVLVDAVDLEGSDRDRRRLSSGSVGEATDTVRTDREDVQHTENGCDDDTARQNRPVLLECVEHDSSPCMRASRPYEKPKARLGALVVYYLLSSMAFTAIWQIAPSTRLAAITTPTEIAAVLITSLVIFAIISGSTGSVSAASGVVLFFLVSDTWRAWFFHMAYPFVGSHYKPCKSCESGMHG